MIDHLRRLARDWRVVVFGFFAILVALRLLSVAGVVPHWLVVVVLLVGQGVFVAFVVTMLLSRSRS